MPITVVMEKRAVAAAARHSCVTQRLATARFSMTTVIGMLGWFTDRGDLE